MTTSQVHMFCLLVSYNLYIMLYVFKENPPNISIKRKGIVLFGGWFQCLLKKKLNSINQYYTYQENTFPNQQYQLLRKHILRLK